jgi:GrpB-like predicted nucleotidyltransferase (UPF0157 family)
MENERSESFSEDRLRAVTIGEPQLLNGPVVLAEYDPLWPQYFAEEAACVRRALGDRALAIEHVGSTSVPGLAAKPIVDMILVVENSSDEAAYVSALESAGYVLRIREPDWYEHRAFKGPRRKINLHVFSRACTEVDRMIAFRDRLRASDADRNAYEAHKRELAGRNWKYVQNYADAKAKFIEEMLARQ